MAGRAEPAMDVMALTGVLRSAIEIAGEGCGVNVGGWVVGACPPFGLRRAAGFAPPSADLRHAGEGIGGWAASLWQGWIVSFAGD